MALDGSTTQSSGPCKNVMGKLYRLVTPAVILSAALLSALDGNYMIALSAALLLVLLYNNGRIHRCTSYSSSPPPGPAPLEIVASGPSDISYKKKLYPDWVQTENGEFYHFYPTRKKKLSISPKEDRITYRGVRYIATGPRH